MPDLTTRCRPLLGTFVEVSVPSGHAEAIQSAYSAMAHIHGRMSFHDPQSDLRRLCAARPGAAVAVSSETVAVMREALRLHALSDGLFDPTIGRELVAAGFLPSHGIGELARFDGCCADIEILAGQHIRLKRPVLLDLGGIAKGYAVDCAVEALEVCGVPEGLVNTGGDLRVFGAREWPVGLRDADDVVRQTIMVRNCAVASSANRCNRRRSNGRTWTPHIGRGRRPILAADRITVIADKCMLADAMTKVAMCDRKLAERLLSEDGKVLPSSSELAEAC